MGMFKTIKDSEIYFYSDFRKGSFKEETGKAVTTDGSGVLNNVGMEVRSGTIDPYVITKGSEANIGTKDFTVIAKFNTKNFNIARAVVGLGLGTATNNCFPMILNSSDNLLAIKFGTVVYSSNFAPDNNTVTAAITCDRDGLATFFKGGVKTNTQDISSHSSANIIQTNYAVGSLGNTNWGLGGLVEYALLIDGCLTETEVAQLTAELENMKFTKKVIGRTGERKDGYVFDGSSVYGTIDTLAFSHDKDWSTKHYWKVEGNGNERVLLGSTTADTTYVMRMHPSSLTVYIYNGTNSAAVTFSTAFIEGDLYKIETSYNASTTTWEVVRTNLSSGIDNETATVDLSVIGSSWTINCDLFGKRGNNSRYMDGSIYGLEVTIDGTKHYITRNAKMNDPKPTHIFDKDIQFKTDFGAIANERAITSGQLENTPFEVQSGSFKVMNNTIDGQDVKTIECATNGVFSMPTSYFQQDSSYGEWEFCVNKSSSAGSTEIAFIANQLKWPYSPGYGLRLYSNGQVKLVEQGVGNHFESAVGTFDLNEWNTFKITRDKKGKFFIYLNNELIPASVGSNPFTDNTVKISKNISFEPKIGDKIMLSNKKGDLGTIKK